MKKTFAEKSTVLAFLGMATVMSVALFLINSCNKKENSAEKKSQKKNPTAKVVTDHRRVIYLTFDDGPNKGTENLLKIVHKHKIPITAFIVGKHVFGSRKQSEDFKILENDSLVELANHSFTHASNNYATFYQNPEMVVEDFNQAKDSVKFKNNYARTPGRNIWRLNNVYATDIKKSKEAADLLQKNNYKVIGWDLEWKPDQKMHLKGTHEQMLKKIDSIYFNDLEKTSRHLVLLTHDQYLTDENSVKELDLFIQKLKESNRFQFKKISDYPKINEVLY